MLDYDGRKTTAASPMEIPVEAIPG